MTSTAKKATAKKASVNVGAAAFRPASLAFLRGLAEHNAKPWFEEHRAEYEREVREPLIALVEEVDARLGEVAPEMVGDRKRSVFRIHRDVRFAKDKRPYKTNAACWFFHRDVRRARGGEGSDSTGAAVHGGAGFYFQLAPDDCWCGGGIWMPPREALAHVRDRIAARHDEWEAIVGAPAFRRRFGALDTEAVLTRVPRGYAADHPAAGWLRYQSFTAGRRLSESDALAPKLADRLVKDFAVLLPMVRWINEALGFRAADRR